jgi:hypothetical protein
MAHSSTTTIMMMMMVMVLCVLAMTQTVSAQALNITYVPPSITIECGTPTALNYTGGSANFTGVGCNVRPGVSYSDSVPTGGCMSQFTRTFTVTDGCGTYLRATQVITISDTKAPVITLTGNNTVLECGQSTAVSSTLGATAVDACTTQISLTYADTNFATGKCGLTVEFDRVWTARDVCGNTATSSQHIKTQDTTRPLLVIPNNRIFECPAPSNLTAGALGDAASATDACVASGVLTPTYVDSAPAYSCNSSSVPAYVLRRTWTATDPCGLVTNATQTLTVRDTRPPTIDPQFNVTVVECNPTVPLPVTTVNATDLCDPAPKANYTDVVARNNCGRTQIVNRNWNVVDACGNKATFRHELHVVDTLPPAVTTPPTATVECNSTNPATLSTGVATGVDQCSLNVTVTYSDVLNTTCASQASLIRTWSVLDQCGLGNKTTQIINVRDTVAPSIVAPAALRFECGVTAGVNVVPALATATDACDPVPRLTYSGALNLTLVGVYTRTWNATDKCGNVATAAQTITVNDTRAPELILPADIIVSCTLNATNSSVTGTPTYSDLCDPKASLVLKYADQFVPTCGLAGLYYRTWNVTDSHGNTASKTQRITVIDDKAPVIVAPASLTVNCNASLAANNITGTGNASVTDNCGAVVSFFSRDQTISVGCSSSRDILRTWYATDQCGKSSSATQLISVRGTVAPVVTAPAAITLECGVNSTLPSTAGMANATSQCNRIMSITYSDTVTGKCGLSKLITRTWRATDDCGLVSAGVVQNITLADTTKPHITISPASSAVIDCSRASLFAAGVSASAVDTCGSANLTFADTVVPGVAGCAKRNLIRTYTSYDQCGNVATAVYNATIVDTEAPVFSNALSTSLILNCGDATGVTGEAGNATATDNCSSFLVSYVDSVSTPPGATVCATNQLIKRTYSAVDACGNNRTLVQTISITDRTPPRWATFQSSVVLECGAAITVPFPTATDNCGTPNVTLVSTTSAAACGNTTTQTRTYTASDVCGNTITRQQTVRIVDRTAPLITVSPTNPTISCSANFSLTAVGGFTVTDACDSKPTITSTDRLVSRCGAAHVTDRTIFATDACGNVGYAVQRITVNSVTPTYSSTPSTFTLQCGSPTAPGSVPAPLYNSTCGFVPTVTSSDVSTINACGVGSIKRTWKASDGCELPLTVTQTINVVENATLTLAQPTVSVMCNASLADATTAAFVPPPTYRSSCVRVPTITFTDSALQGPCTAPYFLRTYTSVDGGCTTLTAVQNVSLQVPPPSLTIANPNVTISCNVSPTTNITGVAQYAGTCNRPTANVSYTDVANLSCGIGSITRTWTSVDGCYTRNVVQVINLTGSISFSIAAPTLTLQCNGFTNISNPEVSGSTAVYSNSCGRTATPTYSDVTSNGCTGTRNITRTWSVSPGDNCGTQTVMQEIRVVDTLPPTFTTSPPSVTVVCGANTSVQVLGSATATDSCGGAVSVTFVDTPATTMVFGGLCPTQISRLWTATDACGNMSTYLQTISITPQPI